MLWNVDSVRDWVSFHSDILWKKMQPHALLLLLVMLIWQPVESAFFGPKLKLEVCNGQVCSANNFKKTMAAARSCGFSPTNRACMGGCKKGTYVCIPGVSTRFVANGQEKETLQALAKIAKAKS